jgi:hypothetical protein
VTNELALQAATVLPTAGKKLRLRCPSCFADIVAVGGVTDTEDAGKNARWLAKGGVVACGQDMPFARTVAATLTVG